MPRQILWFKETKNFLASLVASLMVLLAVIFSMLYAVNVPIQDQWWSSVQIAIMTAQQEIDFESMFIRTYEHYFAFSNTITIINTLLNNWDIRIEVAINLFLVLLNALVLVAIARKEDKAHLAIYILIIFLLQFSFRTRSSWLWSLTTAHYFSYLCFFAGIFVLQTNLTPWRKIVLISVLNLFSVYSFSAGLASILVLSIALFVYGYRQAKHLVTWCLIHFLMLVPILMTENLNSSFPSFRMQLDTLIYDSPEKRYW